MHILIDVWRIGFRLRLWDISWEQNLRIVFNLFLGTFNHPLDVVISYGIRHPEKRQWRLRLRLPYFKVGNDMYIRDIKTATGTRTQACWEVYLFKWRWCQGGNPDA